MYKNIKQLIKDRDWANKMKSGGLDSFDNYSGPDLSGWIMGCSRSRDSDIMADSNFETMLEKLGGESKSVQVNRFNHWACGWVESIMVSSKATKKLETLRQCLNSIEKYPLLDESDYYERERDKIDSDWECYQGDFSKEVCKSLNIPVLKSSKLLDTVTRSIYEEDCSYMGHEDAFVTDKSIQRWADTYECKELSKTNKYAKLVMNKFRTKE